MAEIDNESGKNPPSEEGQKSATPLTGMIGQAWFDEFATELSWEALVKWLRDEG